MSNQELKLREAEYFYNKMVGDFQNELFESFSFNLSAFLTASRSILQYTHDYAKSTRKLNQYDDLVTNNPILIFFKEKRDLNIHTVPVQPIQQVNIAMQFSINIRESIKITRTDSDGNIIDESEYEQPNTNTQNSHNNQTKRTLLYKFTDWDGEEDILELSEKYLKELRKFIINAKNESLII